MLSEFLLCAKKMCYILPRIQIQIIICVLLNDMQILQKMEKVFVKPIMECKKSEAKNLSFIITSKALYYFCCNKVIYIHRLFAVGPGPGRFIYFS